MDLNSCIYHFSRQSRAKSTKNVATALGMHVNTEQKQVSQPAFLTSPLPIKAAVTLQRREIILHQRAVATFRRNGVMILR